MDIRAQLRKYKIQINELTDVWQTARQRELNIHKAETERIATKTAEFRECCSIEAAELQARKMVILEEISLEQSKLNRIGSALSQLHNTKFKLRQEVLIQIHAENRAKKDTKRNRAVFEKQLADIQLQINQQQKIVDGYENARRQINEDFYNWREECSETQQKISDSDPTAKKTAILKAYLAELSSDTRAKPDNRYTLLDEDKSSALAIIEQLGYQYTKLQTYITTFNDNLVSQGEQVMSSYLRDASAEIPMLKKQQSELAANLVRMQQTVDELDRQITELGIRDIPNELKEQTIRAQQRLLISGERLTSEYEPLISNLREQVSCLEHQLMNTPGSGVLEHCLGNIVQVSSSNNTGQDGIHEGILEGIPKGMPEEVPVLVVGSRHEQVIDLSGKSRKEIERLKKQQRQDIANLAVE